MKICPVNVPIRIWHYLDARLNWFRTAKKKCPQNIVHTTHDTGANLSPIQNNLSEQSHDFNPTKQNMMCVEFFSNIIRDLKPQPHLGIFNAVIDRIISD